MEFRLLFNDFDVMMEEKSKLRETGFSPKLESHDLTEETGSMIHVLEFESNDTKVAKKYFSESKDVYEEIDKILQEMNKYHDCAGNFSDAETIKGQGPCPDSKGIGSVSNGHNAKNKQQITAVSKKGAIMTGTVFKSGMCGRKARDANKNIQCYGKSKK